MVAMLRINHKIISVVAIFHLIVCGGIPATGADMSDHPDVPNIADFHKKMADNYNKIALQHVDPNFKRQDFCRIILDSAWSD